jgi:nucleotide-binding universal stress UspA family protein
MLPFRRILFPVDYSEPCRAIVPYIWDFVTHYAAELTVVHAYGFEARKLDVMDPSWRGDVQSREEQRLRAFVAEAFPGLRVNTAGEWGEPGTVIDKIVKRDGTDLVMLPTRGEGLLRRLLIGSVTAKVLHDVSAAVWTGTGTGIAGHDPAVPYKSLLCAIDLTKESEGVLVAARAIAESYGAQLSLVHAIDPPPATIEIDYAPFRQGLIEAAQSDLMELKKKLGMTIEHRIVDGPAEDGVRQEALRTKADLIVAGRGHAGEGLSRIWSRLYGIVREAPCPVLSI